MRFAASSVEEVQNVVTGEMTLSGITLAEAEENRDAIKTVIADGFGIEESAITSLEFEEVSSRSRRLTELAAVYEIEVESEDAGETLVQAITETSPSTMVTAITEAVEDAGVTIDIEIEISTPTVTTEEELEIAPTAAPETDAPTMLPTPSPTLLPTFLP